MMLWRPDYKELPAEELQDRAIRCSKLSRRWEITMLWLFAFAAGSAIMAGITDNEDAFWRAAIAAVLALVCLGISLLYEEEYEVRDAQWRSIYGIHDSYI